MAMKHARSIGAVVALAISVVGGSGRVVAATTPPDPVAGEVKDLSPDTFVPTANDLVGAQALQVLSGMRSELERRYPDDFAGLWVDVADQQAFKIATVGDPGPVEAAVTQALDGVTLDPALRPSVTYVRAKYSLAALHAIQAQLEGETDQLRAQGLVVESFGINDTTNQVVANLPDAAPTRQVPLATPLTGLPVELRVSGKVRKQSDREHDVAPFNAGDQIRSTSDPHWAPGGYWCTSGFGVKTGGGVRSLLTAGHCSLDQSTIPATSYFWYNTGVFAPMTNRPMGYTTTAVANNFYDFGLIGVSSSNLFFQNISTKQYVTGQIAPALGIYVCREGSFTASEQCGNIDQIDTAHSFFTFTNSPGNSGDSGGPIVEPSAFGYLGVGTIVGAFGTTEGLGENLQAEEYINGTQVNTFANP